MCVGRCFFRYVGRGELMYFGVFFFFFFEVNVSGVVFVNINLNEN